MVSIPFRPIIVEWREGMTTSKVMPYVRVGQELSDSHGRHAVLVANTMDDEDYARHGYHVLGPVLDVSALTPAEQREFLRHKSTPRKLQNAEDVAAESALTERVLRLTFSGGYDVDSSDPATSHELARRIREEEARRGVVLRESWSGGPTSSKRHLEWGPAEVGHVNLLYAGRGHADDVCRVAGLVRKGADEWVLPTDPHGALGCVDLRNLNRSSDVRDSVFRALGGLHKDRTRRKTLVEGSPREGSRFTPPMIEEGLRLFGHDGKAKARPKRFRPLPPIPDGERLALERARDLVSGWWREGAGHDLRLNLAGTLLQSGLLSAKSVEHLLTATTKTDAWDARVVVESTVLRLRQQRPVRGPSHLRKQVGSLALVDLAWALSSDTGDPFERWRDLIMPREINDAAEVAIVVTKLMERAAHTEDREQKGRIHKVRHRIMSSPACGRREANSRCLACKQSRCKIHLYCGDASCNGCTSRRIRDVLELIVLPKRVRVVHAAGYETKAAAQRDYSRLARYGKRPLALYAPVPNGTWELTLMADERDHGACSVMGALPGATTYYCSEHSARDWIARVFAMKHATARVAIEDPTNERAIDLVLEAYRTHVASSRDTSIAWPTKEQIRAHRRERALAAALENPDAEDPTSCPCPLDTPVSVEVKNLDTGVVVMTDLLTPPTLAQVVAHEAGERVKVNRRRRFGNRSGLRARTPMRC